MNLHELYERVLAEVHAAWRYRWHGLIVAWCTLIVGALLVFALPNVYESSTEVYADTDALMSPLLSGLAVQPNVRNRLQIITQTLLSRPNVETVADKTGLSLRATTPEDRVKLLQTLAGDVKVQGAGSENLYTITYRDHNPVMSQKVVQALLQILMNDTLGVNIETTQTAQGFLQQQVKDYNNRLNDAEKKLADFEKANVGYIPSQGGSDYFTRLQNAEQQLQELRDQYDTAVAGRATVEQQMHAMVTNSGSSGVDPHVQQIDQQIAAYRQKLNTLLLQYTNEYPDVVALRRMIAQLQAERQALEKQAGSASVMEVASDNPVYQDMQKSLYAAQVKIDTLKMQIALQNKQIQSLKARVDRITDVQTTLQQLTRNYDITKKRYNELLSRLDTAQISQDASHSGNNLKFRVINPPIVPIIPVSPKRDLLLALVLVLSLAAGALFAFFLHQIKPVFLSLGSLRGIGDYPVLGALSVIVSSTQRRLMRREVAGFSVGVCLLLVFAATGFLFSNHLTSLIHHFFVMGGT